MNNQQISEKFSELSTPLIADACLRLDIPLRLAPSGIRPISIENHIAGRVLPVRHYGSVDIFLEAMITAQQGDILIIDNSGRLDEGCIGDLTAAHDIWERERKQAQKIRSGKKLSEQLQFDKYLAQRESDERYTFRQHLRSIAGAIEE
jgi:hypothetical protein